MHWLRTFAGEWADVWSMLVALGAVAGVAVALRSGRNERKARERAEDRAKLDRDLAERARAELTVERRQSDAERRREAELSRTEAHRAQAKQVIGWVEQMLADERRSRPRGREVHFVNHSPSPVFAVTIAVFTPSLNTRTVIHQMTVAPGHFADKWRIDSGPDEDQVIVSFRDLGGAHWQRVQDGMLAEVGEDGAIRRWVPDEPNATAPGALT